MDNAVSAILLPSCLVPIATYVHTSTYSLTDCENEMRASELKWLEQTSSDVRDRVQFYTTIRAEVYTGLVLVRCSIVVEAFIELWVLL